ncbi:MAG: transglutaminase domain-containing protein [Lentisphaeria bacterium]|nr:transglutaminase domain-containing protein [Lentisphaeria bacterium]
MSTSLRLLLLGSLTTASRIGHCLPIPAAALPGESIQVCRLAPDNAQIRGLALDEMTPGGPRLLVLDKSGKVFVYGLANATATAAVTTLKLEEVLDLAGISGSPRFENPRGLALAAEDGRRTIYCLDWAKHTPMLWRFDTENRGAASLDLSLFPFRLGSREVLDLARVGERILVCYDASGYGARDLRVQRGILELTSRGPFGGTPERVRHLPDSGREPSRGIASMEMDGNPYLWATVGNDAVYCAEGETGRGIFHFDCPRSAAKAGGWWGLAYGAASLWVPEDTPDGPRVHRVNVTRNLDVPIEGPRVLRHLTMTIQTEPEGPQEDPGKVSHHYSRPYGYEQLGCQGIWVETEQTVDVSAAPNARIHVLTHDPAGDAANRQYMPTVEYDGAPARAYSSRYEIDLWTQRRRFFVYPHRANREAQALEGMDYLADDPVLYNLSDTATYDRLIDRVRSHILRKYGVQADMTNPYWAARNVLEYFQDNYYYPSLPKGRPAAVDYERGHYDANPANRKIELSEKDYDGTQIIACSGTSVMLTGAMRHLGIPARWLGTATEQGPGAWDRNGNGLLDEGEAAPCTNGHRYTQVWLGMPYGWICFDGTPEGPDEQDYDVPPPLRPQWRYMTRAAAGHIADRRVVLNVGSEFLRPLYREFRYDEKLAVDNNCGGDQRYNLQGRFDRPEFWRRPRHRIQLQNLCFVVDVAISGPPETTTVTWQLKGAWDRDPDATLSVYLQEMTPKRDKVTRTTKLAAAIPCRIRAATVDISAHVGKRCRILIRKDGDGETGGQSAVFE